MILLDDGQAVVSEFLHVEGDATYPVCQFVDIWCC